MEELNIGRASSVSKARRVIIRSPVSRRLDSETSNELSLPLNRNMNISGLSKYKDQPINDVIYVLETQMEDD